MNRNHPRVLVVDDEEAIRDLLQEMLPAEGYEVVTARDGAEGIELVKAERSKFDLILIDLMMPKIDGIEVLRSVKQCDPDIGALMITGYTSVDAAVRCMRLGACDYITKPFSRAEIAGRLDEAFRKRRLMLKNKQLIRKLKQRNCELDQIRDIVEQWNVHFEQKVGLQTQKLQESAALQQELVDSERTGAVGEMAAQIGHELNNCICCIGGNAQMIPNDIQAGALSRAVENAECINKSAARMKRFAKELMNLTGTKMEKELCDINALVLETLQFLKPQNRYDDIVFVTDLEADLPPILADPGRIQQVLLNLFNNSVDAMGAGEIRIRTAHNPAEDRIDLSVRDTGPGIPKTIQKKVFDPYFTTREKGHGFGLSVSCRIVKNHHGTIEVESEVGQGATFRIALPVNGKAGSEKQRLHSGILAVPEMSGTGSPAVG
jgi:signal transduction histidine kinase